jgi:translation initiation factor 3 subunit B
MAAITLRPEEEKLFEGQPKGFPFGDFNYDDVMLPEGDDMDIASDDDADTQQEDLQQDSAFGNVIIINNIPKVSQEKYEKLTSILRKLASGTGNVREGGLHHPQDASNTTKGYAFVEYDTPEMARAAAIALHGYQLDKNHKFTALLLDDWERIRNAPDAYTEPATHPFKQGEDLFTWLSDKRGRDQFVIRFGDETEIYWNDPARQQGDAVYKRSFWSETFVEWGPRGSILATMHRQGVAVWGGDQWERLQRFSHIGASRIAFSPCEKYLLTYSEMPPRGGGKTAGPEFLLHVFETRTGRKLRTFEGPQAEYAVGAAARSGGSGLLQWPAFKWSGGGDPSTPRFLAHLKANGVAVYAAPDMGMLDKKTIKLEAIESFEWSPTEPVFAAYQAENGNLPASVVLIKCPERETLRAKNLFSVADLAKYWHPQGDYLAVRVEKWTKTRKSTTTNLELFSLREKNVPVDMLELPNKAEKILTVAWEPKGHRFAILHGEVQRPSLSIYSMKDAKGAVGTTHLHTLPNKQATQLHWSPAGRFLVLAGVGQGHNGGLEFWDVDDMSLMGAGEHFMATEVTWDPTGRYLSTAVTAHNQMENGFVIWSFAGQQLYKTNRDRFYQLSWRPRPPTLLSEEEQKKIVKNLKQYSKRYDEEDEALLASADAELLAERSRLGAEWRDWLSSKKEYIDRQVGGKEGLILGRYGPDKLAALERHTIADVEVSVVVDQKEEPVKGGL